jgi:lipoprotein-releasing system permease protein
MEMNKNLFAALKLEKRVMFIILSLIVLVAAFNIICTLIMIVMEKNKDIAILKSMGATSKSIMKIFIYQGLTIGAIGTLLGCIGGLAVALNLEKVSVFVENLFGFKILPGDVYYLSQLPSQVNYSDVLIIIVGTMLICFLSTIYPSRRASKLDPAEALRYE